MWRHLQRVLRFIYGSFLDCCYFFSNYFESTIHLKDMNETEFLARELTDHGVTETVQLGLVLLIQSAQPSDSLTPAMTWLALENLKIKST